MPVAALYLAGGEGAHDIRPDTTVQLGGLVVDVSEGDFRLSAVLELDGDAGDLGLVETWYHGDGNLGLEEPLLRLLHALLAVVLHRHLVLGERGEHIVKQPRVGAKVCQRSNDTRAYNYVTLENPKRLCDSFRQGKLQRLNQ